MTRTPVSAAASAAAMPAAPPPSTSTSQWAKRDGVMVRVGLVGRDAEARPPRGSSARRCFFQAAFGHMKVL